MGEPVNRAHVRDALHHYGLDGLCKLRDPFVVRQIILDALSDPAPQGWREAIAKLRLGLAAGSRSLSNTAFEIEYGGVLLDAVGEALEALESPAPFGHVMVELDAINNLCEHLKALIEAGSADAKSLAADFPLLLGARRG